MSDTRRRLPRGERAARAASVFDDHDGVAHRADLRRAGVSREDVRAEVLAGRWTAAGRHTVIRGRDLPPGRARLWRAVWESGPMAVLDGVSALQAAGLAGFSAARIEVSLPRSSRVHRVEGVRARRRARLGRVLRAGLPRAATEAATIRGAQWARSDREAALVICLAVQQRLVHPERLLEAWNSVRGGARHRFIDAVLRDVCDGAHSLGELDLGRMCRRRGIPPPDRQVLRHGPGGRMWLDCLWEDVGLVVEVDGAHHLLALNPVDDALRANELVIGGERVLRLPVLALRLDEERCLDQLERAREALLGHAAA